MRFWVPKFREREQVVTLPDGTRARVHVDDSGTVRHTETDDRLDVVVRPKTVTVRVRRR